MPQANSHNITESVSLNRATYEREAIATIATLFRPLPAPPPAANTTPPARLLVKPAADAARIRTGLFARPDFARLGVNAMPRCQWYGQCRPNGAGICLDCGLSQGEVR